MNTEELYEDALQHADHAGLFEEEDEACLHGIYDRAGFHGDTHVDVAMQHTCQLHAGLTLLYGEDHE